MTLFINTLNVLYSIQRWVFPFQKNTQPLLHSLDSLWVDAAESEISNASFFLYSPSFLLSDNHISHNATLPPTVRLEICVLPLMQPADAEMRSRLQTSANLTSSWVCTTPPPPDVFFSLWSHKWHYSTLFFFLSFYFFFLTHTFHTFKTLRCAKLVHFPLNGDLLCFFVFSLSSAVL